MNESIICVRKVRQVHKLCCHRFFGLFYTEFMLDFLTWGFDIIIFIDKARHDTGSNSQQCHRRSSELNAKNRLQSYRTACHKWGMGSLPIYLKPPISTYFTIWFESNFVFSPLNSVQYVQIFAWIWLSDFHHSTERNIRSVVLVVG